MGPTGPPAGPAGPWGPTALSGTLGSFGSLRSGRARSPVCARRPNQHARQISVQYQLPRRQRQRGETRTRRSATLYVVAVDRRPTERWNELERRSTVDVESALRYDRDIRAQRQRLATDPEAGTHGAAAEGEVSPGVPVTSTVAGCPGTTGDGHNLQLRALSVCHSGKKHCETSNRETTRGTSMTVTESARRRRSSGWCVRGVASRRRPGPAVPLGSLAECPAPMSLFRPGNRQVNSNLINR